MGMIGRIINIPYNTWNHWHQPGNKVYCTHTWHASLTKYDWNIANVFHIANILHWHIEPAILHKYATTQPTAITISHIITKYVPEQTCPPN